VTLYRVLRRIQGNELKGLVLEAWQAADAGNWGAFIKLMGGPTVSRKDCPLKTGRQWSDEPNRYLEPKGFKIIGVEYSNVLIPTRIHQWTVKYQPEQVQRVFSSENELNLFTGPPLAPLNWGVEYFEKIRLFAS
jgi:hypothetical protein